MSQMDQSWAKFGPNLAKIAFRCALAMIDVGSCGRDHRRGGCSNLNGPIFFWLLILLNKKRFWRNSKIQFNWNFKSVWFLFASIRDMLPIRVIRFWFGAAVRAFLIILYLIIRPFGFFSRFFEGLFSSAFTVKETGLFTGTFCFVAIAKK